MTPTESLIDLPETFKNIFKEINFFTSKTSFYVILLF